MSLERKSIPLLDWLSRTGRNINRGMAAWIARLRAGRSGTERRGPTASEPVFNARRGVWEFETRSEYLWGKNLTAVLLPDDFDRSRKYPVVYLLPVEEGSETQYGDSIALARGMDAHNRYGAIFAAPTFDTLPWYGSHATNPLIRHDEYMVRDLVPMIEQRWPTTGTAEGRLLIGFSKSGCGAFTLMARHPEVFGYAASWDAPLMLGPEGYGCFSTDRHFGTREQFSRYLVPGLLRANAAEFTGRTRLVVAGANLFGDWPKGHYAGVNHTAEAHVYMEGLGIRHSYLGDVYAEHAWNEIWMRPVLDALLELAREQ